MSFLSDLFGGADQAAQDQIAGINKGQAAATANIGQGNQDLTSNFTAGLQPFLQNYAGAGKGTAALGNLLGLNGAPGSNSAQNALQTMPGYQAAIAQGDNSINAAAAANGTLNSGNQISALGAQNTNLANQNYGNYVSQLQTYLGAQGQAAAGIGGLYAGLGSGLNANQGTLANLNYGADTSIGNANASAALADQSMGLNLLGGGVNLAASLFSDERLKEDIAPVGELYDGQTVYSYNYKGDDTPRIGLIAQEVEERYPAAVTEIGGFKAVRYDLATELASGLAKFLEAA